MQYKRRSRAPSGLAIGARHAPRSGAPRGTQERGALAGICISCAARSGGSWFWQSVLRYVRDLETGWRCGEATARSRLGSRGLGAAGGAGSLGVVEDVVEVEVNDLMRRCGDEFAKGAVRGRSHDQGRPGTGVTVDVDVQGTGTTPTDTVILLTLHQMCPMCRCCLSPPYRLWSAVLQCFVEQAEVYRRKE